MTKPLLTFLLFLFLNFTSFAQIQQYDITKYVSPIQKYHTLGTQLNLNGRKRDNPFAGNDTHLFSSLNANYTQYKRTPKHQSSIDSRFNLQYAIKKEKATPSNPLNQHTNTYLSKGAMLNTNNQFFIRSKRFIELDLFADLHFASYKDQSPKKTPDILSHNDINISFHLPILFGFGRINNITENWRAARMLTEFQKTNSLTHEPKEQEINDLSEVFTQRRYTRLFDYREKNKADLKKIHQNLIENNLISQADIDYFSTLADMWYYGANAVRLSGFSMAIGIEPQFNKKQHKDLAPNKTAIETSFLSGYLTLKTIYEKPINSKFQFSLNSNIKFGQIYYRAPYQSLFRKLGNHIDPYLKLALGYYPTTRTYLSTSISSHASTDRRSVYAEWQTSLYYYLSPQTRLTATTYFRKTREAPFNAISQSLNNHQALENYQTSLTIKILHNFL